MKALLLRLDAPIMSFGGVMVDQNGYIERFPGTSMLCGMIANALGWQHNDFGRLQDLQARIEYAARWDEPPQRIIDYHTVDLGQPKMAKPGWTTRGVPDERKGGESAKRGIHQRYRHYWTDGLMTVALTLKGNGYPDIEAVKSAIQQPVRPLFLGRKTCLPARPLLDPHTPIIEGASVLAILKKVPLWDRDGTLAEKVRQCDACWPAHLGKNSLTSVRRVFDLRDWANQVPAGSRWRASGRIGGED